MMTPEQFAEKLHQVLPDALKSVILYGSAAAGDFVAGRSHYDVLIVVEPLGTAQLDALRKTVQEWMAAGNPAPQMMTVSELAASADVFPLEWLDIQQSRRILWGADLFAELKVHPGDVRRQLERELKGKLLRLRQRYLLAGTNPRRLGDLMVNSISTFLVLMRGALRLYQTSVPATKKDSLVTLARHVPFDPQPFLTVLQLKDGTLQQRDVDLPQLFQDYLATVERVVATVDQPIHQTPSQETPS